MDTLSQFSSHIDISELKLPDGTMVFEEEEGKVRTASHSIALMQELCACTYIACIHCMNVCISYNTPWRDLAGIHARGRGWNACIPA